MGVYGDRVENNGLVKRTAVIKKFLEYVTMLHESYQYKQNRKGYVTSFLDV